MFPAGAKSSESAVDGEPGISATVWFNAVPVQSIVAKRWKTTLPVGAGTPAGVPAALATNTLSCTIVPAATVVTTAPEALRMSVRTASSAQSFDASTLSPALASPLSRCNVTPPTATSVFALIVDEPVVLDVITTVHEPDPAEVVQPLGPTKLAGPASVKLIVVPFGALA